MSGEAPFLTTHGLCKAYPGVVALRDVDFEVSAGEVIALVGKNGAGKSTLIKSLAGAVQPDSGEIRLDGEPVSFSSPTAANAHGLAFVHQELADVPTLTVAENVLLGNGLPRRILGRFVDWKQAARQAREALADLDPTIDPQATVASLSVAQRRLVMIAQALQHKARLLVLDEPTAALSISEIEHLHGVVRKLAGQGVAVVYVSHRLGEVFDLTDRTVVMRDGAIVANKPTTEFDRTSLIAEISGHDVEEIPEGPQGDLQPAAIGEEESAHVHGEYGPVVLEAKGLTRTGVVEDASFSVRAGEILGIAGLVGSGRTELLRLLIGADKRTAGEVYVKGEQVPMRSPKEAAGHGIVLLPEDRRGQGLIMNFTVRENITITHLDEFRRVPALPNPSIPKEQAAAREAGRRLAIKTASVEVPVGTLSGGNQQKVVLGKWLGPGADVFIFDEPTAGIDVDGRDDTYERLRELAAEGKAVIVVSSDFSELPGLCDRVLVMADGRLTDEIEGDEVTERALVTACFEGIEGHSAVPADDNFTHRDTNQEPGSQRGSAAVKGEREMERKEL